MNAPTTAAVRCPYCREPVAGLLSGCPRKECVRRELDDDRAHVRRADQ